MTHFRHRKLTRVTRVRSPQRKGSRIVSAIVILQCHGTKQCQFVRDECRHEVALIHRQMNKRQNFTHGSLYSLLTLGAGASIASEEHIAALSSLEVEDKSSRILPALLLPYDLNEGDDGAPGPNAICTEAADSKFEYYQQKIPCKLEIANRI